jgi:hypothetical protein
MVGSQSYKGKGATNGSGPTARPRRLSSHVGGSSDASPRHEKVIGCLLDASVAFWQGGEGSAFVSLPVKNRRDAR